MSESDSVKFVCPSAQNFFPTVVRRHVWFRNLVNEEALAY